MMCPIYYHCETRNDFCSGDYVMCPVFRESIELEHEIEELHDGVHNVKIIKPMITLTTIRR
jgi:hypothetical protein